MSRKGEFFDIITLDSKQIAGGRIPWLYKQKLIHACIAEGISFEFCYGEALQDDELRRQVNFGKIKLIDLLFLVYYQWTCAGINVEQGSRNDLVKWYGLAGFGAWSI
jgi:hypothetical protein